MVPQTELSLAKPASTGRNLLFAGSAVAATSAMLFWGTGLHPLWFLTWPTPLPVLLTSPRLGPWSAFPVAALPWFLGSLNMWHYLLAAIALPLPLVLVLSVVPACFFGLAVLLFRRFMVRGSLWKAALVFPTFWVTCEYVNNITSPHGTFPNMGYTRHQSGNSGESTSRFLTPPKLALDSADTCSGTLKVFLKCARYLVVPSRVGTTGRFSIGTFRNWTFFFDTQSISQTCPVDWFNKNVCWWGPSTRERTVALVTITKGQAHWHWVDAARLS